MTATPHPETTEAIGCARRIMHEKWTDGSTDPEGIGNLAALVDRYDHLLAEDEPGLFSWHAALYEVAQQAKQAAEKLEAFPASSEEAGQ